MIFALGEDGTLDVFADLLAVQRSCEGIDVESEVWSFFDDRGRPLRAVFSHPNRVTTLFGVITSVASGVFQLVPVEDGSEPGLLSCLEGVTLAPNPHFASLADVRRYATRDP